MCPNPGCFDLGQALELAQYLYVGVVTRGLVLVHPSVIPVHRQGLHPGYGGSFSRHDLGAVTGGHYESVGCLSHQSVRWDGLQLFIEASSWQIGIGLAKVVLECEQLRALGLQRVQNALLVAQKSSEGVDDSSTLCATESTT